MNQTNKTINFSKWVIAKRAIFTIFILFGIVSLVLEPFKLIGKVK